MLKTELITLVSEEAKDFTKKDVEAILNAFAKVVKEKLSIDEEIPVVGLGKIAMVEKAEREVFVNPRMPELGKKTISAHKSPKFKASKEFKELVK